MNHPGIFSVFDRDAGATQRLGITLAVIVQDGTNGPIRGAASFRMEKKTAD